MNKIEQNNCNNYNKLHYTNKMDEGLGNLPSYFKQQAILLRIINSWDMVK